MSKLIGPDFIALQVADLEASREFYTERLGLKVAGHSPQTPLSSIRHQSPLPYAARSSILTHRPMWGGACHCGSRLTMLTHCIARLLASACSS